MKMKRKLFGRTLIGAATIVCLVSPAIAEEEEEGWFPGSFSGSATIISDYSFRGISQTQTDLAFQGGITWSHDVGFYVGTWGSTIKFPGDNSYLEQDFFAGYAGAIDAFSYDLNATYFLYPKEHTYNYWEFAAKGAYDFGPAAVNAGIIYSPDYFGLLDTGVYLLSGLSVPLSFIEMVDVTASANFGYTTTDDPLFANGDDDYYDWNMGVIIGVTENVSVDLRYIDTDEGSLGNFADARFVGGVTLSI